MRNLKQQIAGRKYENTGLRARGRVAHYHGKPAPVNHGITEFKSDVDSLKSRHYHMDAGCYVSNYSIGFEIEKNSLHRNAVKEYPFFCGFERDGSCGYEAVSHIIPLLPASMWRTKIFSMIYDCEHIIDDQYSPSDYRCGGHITISARNHENGQMYTGAQLAEKIRPVLGLLYSMFKKRLNNQYSRNNLNMVGTQFMFGSDMHPIHNGHGRKFCPVLPKGNLLEFRLVNRFTSVKQLKLRYQLVYEMLDFALTRPNGTMHSFLNKVTPILSEMYDYNISKIEEVKADAKQFRRYLMSYGQTIPTSIKTYVDYHGQNRVLNRNFNS